MQLSLCRHTAEHVYSIVLEPTTYVEIFPLDLFIISLSSIYKCVYIMQIMSLF